tara:strand:+ start:566 stop:829 length:264 start_codon:yes stop_codon:yes gene_type:complete
MKTQLPKWFDGRVGTINETVKNPFSGQSYELNPEETAMYDYIMGIQFLIERKGGLLNPSTRNLQIKLRKGLDWFRKNNAKAYMVLLD